MMALSCKSVSRMVITAVLVRLLYPSEGESQNRDLLLVTVSRREDMIFLAGLLLVFIHIDNLLPILSYLVQTFGLADVDEVEDVPRIGSNGAGDFLHVCSCLFTEL